MAILRNHEKNSLACLPTRYLFLNQEDAVVRAKRYVQEGDLRNGPNVYLDSQQLRTNSFPRLGRTISNTYILSTG